MAERAVNKFNPDEDSVVSDLLTRGRGAMAVFTGATQAQVDEAVTALAWSVYNRGVPWRNKP